MQKERKLLVSQLCGLSLEKTTPQFSWKARKTVLHTYFCVLCRISEIGLFEAKNSSTRISEFSSLLCSAVNMVRCV